MKIPTVICRLKTDEEGYIKPGVEYLARDGQVLFEQAEWSWVDGLAEAYRFEDTYPAEAHLVVLKEAGEKHVHTMVLGGLRIPPRASVHELPHLRVSPDVVYAETQRRLGERE